MKRPEQGCGRAAAIRADHHCLSDIDMKSAREGSVGVSKRTGTRMLVLLLLFCAPKVLAGTRRITSGYGDHRSALRGKADEPHSRSLPPLLTLAV
jgi:hypothetical protein